MLSSVLNSKQAIQINIHIMRVYVRLSFMDKVDGPKEQIGFKVGNEVNLNYETKEKNKEKMVEVPENRSL
jgi:hypothetical protein